MTTIKSNSSHNKKRNPGLIVEFLMKRLSTALVQSDERSAKSATKLLRKRVNPGTRLYKEYKVIDALVNASVDNPTTARAVLVEARKAILSCDKEVLNSELNMLISEINKEKLNEDGCFYETPVPLYREYATVSQLIKEWRAGVNPLEIVRLEEVVANSLVKTPQEKKESLTESMTAGESRLLIKIMLKKMNEKYDNTLSSEQKRLLSAYVTSSEDLSHVRSVMHSIKERLESALRDYTTDNMSRDKLAEVKNMLSDEQITEAPITEETVKRFMGYSGITCALTDGQTGEKN
jgi:uncharacterized membrane protein YheB (UPF0754 family)